MASGLNISVDDIMQGIRDRGIGADVVSQEDFTNPISVSLTRFANALVSELRENLADRLEPSRDGSPLAQSIQPKDLKTSGTLIVTGIEANDYWNFVEEGVDGIEQGQGSPFSFKTPHVSKSHAEAIQEWIPSSGYTMPSNFDDFGSWSYAIAYGIKQRGLKPKPFVKDTFTDENLAIFSEVLLDITGVHFEILFDSN